MTILRAIWDELIGLFVDDLRLAIAILVWLGLCWAGAGLLGGSVAWPILLVAGLALALVESVVRGARAKRR